MWIILYCIISTLQITNRPCHGLNFIDLPGFGSDDDRREDIVVSDKGDMKHSLESSSAESAFKAEDLVKSEEESDSDKKDLRKDQVDGPSIGPEDDILKQMKDEIIKQENHEPEPSKDHELVQEDEIAKKYPPVRSSPDPIYRRHWLVSAPVSSTTPAVHDSDKDEKLKSKISTLVQQTVHDTELKMKIIQKLKEKHRDKAAYKVGFILSMIKKSRDVLNELFNVAIKHRDEWKALEQLKIFELIVHTNVDTTNYVRQLVETHIKNLNSTVRLSRKKKTWIMRSGGADGGGGPGARGGPSARDGPGARGGPGARDGPGARGGDYEKNKLAV